MTLTRTQDLSERDRAVVKLVGDFRQLAASQVRTLLFADLNSQTPLDRTLRRLVESNHLMRLSRLVGGYLGGSGQYVYQLGRAGWRLLDRAGEYWAPKAVNLHALAIVDCRVSLARAERAGVIDLIRFDTEPGCHRAVGESHLTPDGYIELKHQGQMLRSWLEVDRGTEHLDKIQEKCERYWRAYTSGQWDGVFPFVLFVVPGEQRKQKIERVIQAGPGQARKIFSVCLAVEFPRLS
jgi:hypothetical protein